MSGLWFAVRVYYAGACVYEDVLRASDLRHAYRLLAYVALTAARAAVDDPDPRRVSFEAFEAEAA